MQRMCKVCNDWHDLDEPWPVKCDRHFKAQSGPSIISDSMEYTKHHGTGRMIASKREFSRETRDSGHIELGTEVPKPRQPIALDRGQRRDAIRQSLYQLRNSTGPRFDA